jgi:hypothetical protein
MEEGNIEMNFEELSGRVWTGLTWPRIKTCDRLL